MKTSPTRRSLFLGIAITLLVALARSLDMGDGMALRGLDLLFWLRGPQEPATPICIVAIDNESFNEMPERWVWPRDFHARLIRQIMKGSPKVIAFDVLFTEESVKESKQDLALATACRSAGNVIMGAELVQVVDKHFSYEELKLPIKVLQSAIYRSGVVNTPKDTDGFVRNAKLVWRVHDQRHFSLSLEVLRKFLSVPLGEINIEPGMIEFGDVNIPVDHDGKMLVNFRGPAKTFRTFSYYQVYKGMINPEEFRDAIVLVGATAEDLHDTFHTPFSWEPVASGMATMPMPGVEIHANAIETIAQRAFIRRLEGFEYLLIIGLGMLVSIVTIKARVWLTMVVAIVVALGVGVLSAYMFIVRSEYVSFVHTLYAVFLSFLGATTYRAAFEFREKQRVRTTFSRYVSPQVLTKVLSAPPELGGVRREATVLFSDVRGFTPMVEKMDPHDVVAILNEYLSGMVDVVLAHEGTLDKFVGDAIMAVFGSPTDQPDHPLRAVSAAWEMSQTLKELQRKWVAEGRVPLSMGVGINTGELIAGNMGSPQRMEFTVIGDTVNTASRLETATKDLGCQIIMSAATYVRVKDFVEVREHPPVRLKGKEHPLHVYELLVFTGRDQLKLKPKPKGKSK